MSSDGRSDFSVSVEGSLHQALALATILPPSSSPCYALRPSVASLPLSTRNLTHSIILQDLRRPLPSHPLLYSPLRHHMVNRSLSSLSSSLLKPASNIREETQRAAQAVSDAVLSACQETLHLLSLISQAILSHGFRLPIPVPAISPIPSLPRDAAFAAIIPGDSVAELVLTRGLVNFFDIFNTLLIVRLVLTWFPSAPQAIVSPLATICDPYLNLFRGIIPPLGGTLDLSPLLAFLLLNVFTSTSAALPAEMPEEMREGKGASRRAMKGSRRA